VLIFDIPTIDQTLHGYERGHRLLATSFPVSPEDDRVLLTMSDLSGSRVAERFLEYLTGYMLPSGSHYAIAKTWYADEMKRPGCVWTHTLLIPFSAIQIVKHADQLLSLFVRPKLHSDFRYTEKLPIPREALRSWGSAPINLSEIEKAAIEELYTFDDGSVGVIAQTGTEYEVFLLRLWSQMWADLRMQVGFCSGALSRRVIAGRPLDVQCGPERILRELRTERPKRDTDGDRPDVILNDLSNPGRFREFLHKHISNLKRRSSMSAIAKIYRFFDQGERVAALQEVAKAFPTSGEATSLKRVLLQDMPSGIISRTGSQVWISLLCSGPFDLLISDIMPILSQSLRSDKRAFVLEYSKSDCVMDTEISQSVFNLMSTHLDWNDFEWLIEEESDLFSRIVLNRPDLAYQGSFWMLNASSNEKVDLFRLLSRRKDVEKSRLFAGVFSTKSQELLTGLVGELTEAELPIALEWITQDMEAGARPEWIAYLKQYISKVIPWLNGQEVPTDFTAVLAANVLDLKPDWDEGLTSEIIVKLASVAQPIASKRHEVIAFVYLTTARLRGGDAEMYCLPAFAELHRAIAQSRLSNRAWQLLEPILLPIPHQQWDSCEKLRRATLDIMARNKWATLPLWNILRLDTNLFYDFSRTAKSYSKGKKFFQVVYDAAQAGKISLEKKQEREIRKIVD
jgi:hypothetical protein